LKISQQEYINVVSKAEYAGFSKYGTDLSALYGFSLALLDREAVYLV
jgi:hypothetical protein